MSFSTFIDRYFERSCLHFISITILIVTVIALVYNCLIPMGQKTFLGTHIKHDYDALYVAGEILLEHHPGQLYNMELQSDAYHKLRPFVTENQTLPFCYPPFFALIFWPLALLPYIYSYLIWLLITAGFYLLGLFLILRSTRYIPASQFLTCTLLALSFGSFLQCWVIGQTSSFGFLAMALSFHFYKRQRNILSGFALGLCLYKPTLLIIILPFLLFSRQLRILWGFVLSALVLALLSVIVFGRSTCVDWFELVFWFAETSTGKESLSAHLYFDVIAFFQLLFGNPGQTAKILIFIIYGIVFIVYACLLRRLSVNNHPAHELVLASILSLTAAFNIYFPVYDSIIIVIGSILTVDAYYGFFNDAAKKFDPKIKTLLILVYSGPVISSVCAKYTGFQPYTLVLLCLGIYQLFLLRQICHQKKD